MKCQAEECFCTDFNRTFCKNYREDAKPKSKGLKRTPMKKKYKATGEMDLFKHLWETRKHKCYITGRELEFSPSICFHILGKGAFPAYRLNPSNIIFVNAEYTQIGTQCRERNYSKKIVVGPMYSSYTRSSRLPITAKVYSVVLAQPNLI